MHVLHYIIETLKHLYNNYQVARALPASFSVSILKFYGIRNKNTEDDEGKECEMNWGKIVFYCGKHDHKFLMLPSPPAHTHTHTHTFFLIFSFHSLVVVVLRSSQCTLNVENCY